MTTNTTQKLSIAVVICAYNEEDWISKPLESLTKQNRRADEIIIVDNASTDGTKQVIQKFIDDHPGFNIKMVYEAQKGLYRARDAGWRAASTDIIASSDADITFPPDWLEIIERHFQNPETNAITGIWRYTDALPFINWVTAWAEENRLKTGEWQLFGANSAIRRPILEEIDGYVGKPSEAFEDQYITQKLETAGYRVQYLLELRVWHTFRRFNKEGLTGYLKFFDWDGEAIYPDHLSDESPYTVSVVLPTANSAKVIGRSLDSLLKQAPRPHEIVVVDMNSTDKTREIVKQYIAAQPDHCIRLLDEGAKTLQQAYEMGWTAATQELIVQVKPDQIFPENWLAKIHAAFICTRQLGAIGGEIRLRKSQLFLYPIQLVRNMQIRWRNRSAIYLSDQMVAYRRDVAEKLQAAGHRLPIDSQLVAQIQQLGYKVRFNPDLYAIRKVW
jgi:glycosyltransferase involved in cell wall biosynthesis